MALAREGWAGRFVQEFADLRFARGQSSVLNYPDFVVFDIDPYIYSGKESQGRRARAEHRGFEKGKEVAFRLRELLRAWPASRS